jgi:hypothetical protein
MMPFTTSCRHRFDVFRVHKKTCRIDIDWNIHPLGSWRARALFRVRTANVQNEKYKNGAH